MNEASIRMFPRDILYVLSSISKLSAFIYGVIHFNTVQGEMYSKGPKEIQSDDIAENQTSDEKWQAIMESKETVVKIVKDASEIPLIVLHGALPSILNSFKLI